MPFEMVNGVGSGIHVLDYMEFVWSTRKRLFGGFFGICTPIGLNVVFFRTECILVVREKLKVFPYG